MKNTFFLALAVLASSVANAGQLSPPVHMAINPALNPALRPAPAYGSTNIQVDRQDASEGVTRGGGGMPVFDMAEIEAMKKRAAQVEASQPTSEPAN